ncbi:hypothetical protein [uncultured Psychroserpens sp.]|uniref:hypothetical protein n=1 Tax=uncultured Psychroserpens sp. TaxID=255436 RepID=UPI00261282B1|nr:hypothetical protein [uncultured Psychroserpens sp.]
MKSIQTHAHYIEWLSADEMHEASKEWLSELYFIQDEHLFFEDLITTFTSQLISGDKFSDSKALIDDIKKSQTQNNLLIEAIKTHENDLQIMVDGIDQIKEENYYTKEHKNLVGIINSFLNDYKHLKSRLFEIVKTIKKEEKLKHLIDKK